MSGSQLQVRLYRDSFNTPWGFRLQGGKDLGQPLSIQRVFSNSPAEGELQRGDLILAINGRDGQDLTHKQAQDLIKHGGGQIQLVIQRPPPGRVQSTATFKPQRPRAPSLQIEKCRENETPATEGFIKNRLERLQRLKNGEILKLSPVSPTMSGSLQNMRGWPGYDPCYNPDFSPRIQQKHQPFSPSSPHHPPPWASQQFEPKKVSKLSKLGGGGIDFGVDYGTVPRRRHSTQISSSMPHFQTKGHPAKVASLSRLGGGGFDFGVDYCTLPRKSRRQHSQPPASSMPSAGSGFQPKKVTLSRLGGGGPEFGADYTSYRPSYTQPVTIQTRGPPGQQGDMLNRVQESLDNISLSPRTPDYYQYIPTGVRLDMEREQEMRQKQLQQQHSYPGQEQPYSPPQQSYQQPYTPTGVLLEQQGQGEEQEDVVPVHERRKAFMNPPRQTSGPISPNRPPPRVPKPQPGKSPFEFGVDYSKQKPRTSSVTWRPQPAQQRPANLPPPVEVYQASQPSWQRDQDEPDTQQNVPPAWRTSLRSTGVKPWDKDLEYTAGQQQAPRSAPFQPQVSGASFTPQPSGGGQEDGPKVVHLQYNSPIGLYSKENVQETYTGQTKALAQGAPSPGGSMSVQNPAKAGDRDWTQSAVYRMIYEEEHRGQRPPPPQQQQQQQPPQQQQQAPPPPPPKPQTQPQYQQSFIPLEDELGTSDF